MTNGNGTQAPSAITGDSYPYPNYGGVPLQIAIPYLLSAPTYIDLPRYWSWRRDAYLAGSVHKEDMWSSAVARAATKFAAHSFTIKDSKDSNLRIKNAQQIMKQADGGQGWVTFAEKVIQDLLTTDNGVFIRIRRADDQAETIKLKDAITVDYAAQQQTFDEAQLIGGSPAAKITGLYHLDSLRCLRTGNLTYPVRYLPVRSAPQLLRWDQVLMYADMPSSRADLFGVGLCAASRSYHTIATLSALRQMLHEFVAGKGATKLAFLQGISDQTLKGVIKGGELDAQAKGLVYYLGTILGAIPGDVSLSLIEVLLKTLPQGFDPKQIIDDAYLVYANNVGLAVQELQPLSGQGLGTGTQSVILMEQSQGAGALPAFLKWWEQTFSDRVFPATTELEFDNEHDLRDQQSRAQARLTRAQERAARITSGEISPAIARQIAADDGDLAQELLLNDVTTGGQIADDEKPQGQEQISPAAAALIAAEPTSVPARQTVSERGAIPGDASATKSYDALYAAELEIAHRLARWSDQPIVETKSAEPVQPIIVNVTADQNERADTIERALEAVQAAITQRPRATVKEIERDADGRMLRVIERDADE